RRARQRVGVVRGLVRRGLLRAGAGGGSGEDDRRRESGAAGRVVLLRRQQLPGGDPFRATAGVAQQPRRLPGGDDVPERGTSGMVGLAPALLQQLPEQAATGPTVAEAVLAARRGASASPTVGPLTVAPGTGISPPPDRLPRATSPAARAAGLAATATRA